jgi:hypothetical protein
MIKNFASTAGYTILILKKRKFKESKLLYRFKKCISTY